MKKYFFFLLLAFAQLLLWSSCEEDPKCTDITNPSCPNYDPCYGKKSVSAAFKIQEVPYTPVDGWGESFDTDTVATYAITFTALEDNAEYEWHIGSETLTGKSVTRTSFPLGGTYPITLIVKKTPNKSCFPTDDGRDTVTRNMYMVRSGRESPIYGKFKGRVTNPDDTCTIDIRLEVFNTAGRIDTVMVPHNWGGTNNGCSFGPYAIGVGTYKKVYYSHAYFENNCCSPAGIFEIRGKANDTLVIEYTEFRTPTLGSARIKRTFRGVRQ